MMEGGSGIIETSGSKRQKNVESEQDRISSLPDSVLVHILSFLPTVDAIRMVLFPRFGHLWTFIHNLDFDECPYHVCRDETEDEYGPTLEKKFLNLIRRALVLHQSPTLHKFRLKFLFFFYHSPLPEDDPEDPNLQNLFRRETKVANEIDTWIRFAIRREVKVLDLDFLACGDSYHDAIYKLPYFVFCSDFLTELKLAYCGVELRGKKIHMGSLKSLSFKEVRLSDKKLKDILRACPLLEDLFLIECYGLSELNFSVPNLNLTIVLGYEDTSKLRVSCQNLMSFNLLNHIERANLIDLSSLVNATIDFTHKLGCFSMECSEFRTFFEKLHHTKVITLCDQCVLVLTIWAVKDLPCPTSNWKCVILKTRLTKWHIYGISSLLRNSPSLEELNIYLKPCSSNSYMAEEKGLGSYSFDVEGYWSSQNLTFHCLEHHLKIVYIYDFMPENYVIELIEFLLKSALILEKMVITSKKNSEFYRQDQFTSEKLMEFSQKLSGFARASTSAVIMFS